MLAEPAGDRGREREREKKINNSKQKCDSKCNSVSFLLCRTRITPALVWIPTAANWKRIKVVRCVDLLFANLHELLYSKHRLEMQTRTSRTRIVAYLHTRGTKRTTARARLKSINKLINARAKRFPGSRCCKWNSHTAHIPAINKHSESENMFAAALQPNKENRNSRKENEAPTWNKWKYLSESLDPIVCHLRTMHILQ